MVLFLFGLIMACTSDEEKKAIQKEKARIFLDCTKAASIKPVSIELEEIRQPNNSSNRLTVFACESAADDLGDWRRQ